MNFKDLFDALFTYISDHGISLETMIVALIVLIILVIAVFVKIITNMKNKSSSTQRDIIGVNKPFSHSSIGDNNMIVTGNNNTINDEAKIKSIVDEKIKENNKNYHKTINDEAKIKSIVNEKIKENNKNYRKTIIANSYNKPIDGENHTLVFKRK